MGKNLVKRDKVFKQALVTELGKDVADKLAKLYSDMRGALDKPAKLVGAADDLGRLAPRLLGSSHQLALALAQEIYSAFRLARLRAVVRERGEARVYSDKYPAPAEADWEHASVRARCKAVMDAVRELGAPPTEDKLQALRGEVGRLQELAGVLQVADKYEWTSAIRELDEFVQSLRPVSEVPGWAPPAAPVDDLAGLVAPFDALAEYVRRLRNGERLEVNSIPYTGTGSREDKDAYEKLRQAIVRVSQSEARISYLPELDAYTKLKGEARESCKRVADAIGAVNQSKGGGGGGGPVTLEDLAKAIEGLRRAVEDLDKRKQDKPKPGEIDTTEYSGDKRLSVVEHYNEAKQSDDPHRQRYFMEFRHAERVRATGQGVADGIYADRGAEVLFEANTEGPLLVVPYPGGYYVFPYFESGLDNAEAQAAYVFHAEDMKRWAFRRWVVVHPTSCDKRSDGKWKRIVRGELAAPGATGGQASTGVSPSELRSVKEQVRTLGDRQDATQKAIADLRTTVNSLSAMPATRTDEIEKLRSRTNTLFGNIADIQTEMKRLSDQPRMSEADLTGRFATSDSLQLVDSALEQLRGSLSRIDTRQERLDKQFGDLDKRLGGLRPEALDGIERRQAVLDEGLQKLTTEVAGLAERFDAQPQRLEAHGAHGATAAQRVGVVREESREESAGPDGMRHVSYTAWHTRVAESRSTETWKPTGGYKAAQLLAVSPNIVLVKDDRSNGEVGQLMVVELEGSTPGTYAYPDVRLAPFPDIGSCFDLPEDVGWDPTKLEIVRPALVEGGPDRWTLVKKGEFRKRAGAQS
jgi:predicted nuclease with TOPRIM domain